MTWYQFLVPAVVIALAARLDAIMIGPYWSWVEMFPDFADESGAEARVRRSSFERRLAIPGVICFLLVLFWPKQYGVDDAVIVGTAGAGLLLWPIIFHGLPPRVSGGRLAILYGSLVGAFCASSWFGGYMAEFARSSGGFVRLFKESLFGILLPAILMLFFTAISDRVSSAVSRRRDDAASE